MISPRRLLLSLIGLLVLAVAWSVWTAWRTERNLRAAEAAVDRLQSALSDDDRDARDAALADLQDSASAARDRTDGVWWSALTKLPLVGDDAAGVSALSSSLEVVAYDAAGPLVTTIDSLAGLVSEGRVDPAQVAALRAPVGGAAQALVEATDLVSSRQSDGYVSALRTRYDEYVQRISDIADDFRAAETAVDVLPALLGAEGPRDYLFVFQNNAEIRSTGGLPGSWARVHVEDGVVELRQQGSAVDFATGETEVELTAEERAVYDVLPALFFQDAGFIPDFPRTAEIFNAFWQVKYPRIELDGVLSLDPVGMSYLLAGTGDVAVEGLKLTADNIVDELLSNTYRTISDPVEQDLRFERVARALFTATTDDLVSPVDFAQGVGRSIDEGRLLYAPFGEAETERLADSAVLGVLTGDDGSTPHVDIGLNDTTGSKMSYYLRYSTAVQGQSCRDGVQQLSGSMRLNQTISPVAAKALPDDVTGGDLFGTPVGSQLVALRIYGPFGGTINNVRIDGKQVDPEYGLKIDGRPVVTVLPLIESVDDVMVTWDMITGAGQTGDGEVGVTPGVAPGSADSTFASVC